MIPFRAARAYDMRAASDEAGVGDFGPSLTLQSQAEDTDINVIMKRYGVTGQLPAVAYREPLVGDFTGVVDFQTMLNRVNDAVNNFNALPAGLRARFENSPQKLLAFVSDDANMEEAHRLGLLDEERYRVRQSRSVDSEGGADSAAAASRSGGHSGSAGGAAPAAGSGG